MTVFDRSVKLDPDEAENASLYTLARSWMGQGKVPEKPDVEGMEENKRSAPLPREDAAGPTEELHRAEDEESFEGMIGRWKELRRARYEAWKREQARYEPRMEQLLPEDEPSTPT